MIRRWLAMLCAIRQIDRTYCNIPFYKGAGFWSLGVLEVKSGIEYLQISLARTVFS